MHTVESIADVFLIALKSMPKEQQNAILFRIVQDEELSHDLQDLLVFEQTKNDTKRPFRGYLAEKKRQDNDRYHTLNSFVTMQKKI